MVEESSCKGRLDNVEDTRERSYEGGRGRRRRRSREYLVLRLRVSSTRLSKGALGYLRCFKGNLVVTSNVGGGSQSQVVDPARSLILEMLYGLRGH